VIRALLWDVDGTLAETERDGHLVAFNRAFEALDVPWRWSEQHYGELLAVAGGRERLLHDMSRREEAPGDARQREALAETVHRLKNQIYAEIVGGGELPLRAGVAELLSECCRAQLPMGIVTTTSRGNVQALLECQLGSHWQGPHYFPACAAVGALAFGPSLGCSEGWQPGADPRAARISLDQIMRYKERAVSLQKTTAR
jgi:phosphoglycolate phosphatase-like HAD superfamily hydrolase